MNMISTGAFLNEMDASNKQSTAEKFAAVWEKKNARAARAGGVSLMALSLAACGGSSSTTTTTTPEPTTPVEPAAPAAQSLSMSTNGGETISGGDGDDTITGVMVGAAGAGTTAQAGDIVSGGAGTDTLNISASGDVDGHTLSGLQTSGVEKVLISNFDTDTLQTFTVDTSLMSGVETVGLSASGANGDTAFTGMLSIVNAQAAGAGDLTLTYDATAVAGTADTQNVTLANSSGAFTANSIETISVSSTLAANTISTLTADAATTLTVAGDKDLTITAELSATVGNIKTISAGSFTGDLSITNNDTTTNATLGSGDDVYKTSSAVAADYKVDGGAGTDEISVTAATVLDTAAETARYVNFEQVQLNNIGATTAAFNQDMSLLSGIDTVTIVAQDDTDGNADASMTSNLTKVVDGTTVKYESLSTAENAHKFTAGVTVDHATDTSSNSLNVVMGTTKAASGATVTSATNASVYATLTANNAETISITSQGGANTLGALTATDMATLNVDGNKDFTIGNIGSATKLATVDASGMTGTAAFVMGGTNASTTAGTYTGTANDDTFVGGSKADTINAGAGDDTITGGAGDDVLNGGAGDDTFNDSAGDETRNGGDGKDNFKFATANLTSKDTVDGGAGDDTITLTNAATVVDADFTLVSNVETLAFAGRATDVDVGKLADAAGIRTIDATVTGNNDDINIVKDFASDVTVKISDGDDAVTAAATYAGGLTINVSDVDEIDGNDTFTGGAGSDTLQLKLTGTAVTATELAAVTGIETFQVTNNATSGTITLSNNNIADGKALTVDGTAIVSDSNVLTVVGTAETDGALTVLGGAGNDAITGTASDLGDTLKGNGGDDQFNFATANLTKLDVVDGGDGDDTLATSDAGTLVDADFTGITNVENVSLFAGTTVTLEGLAKSAGFSKYTLSTGANSVTVKAGFDADLTLNLVGGTDTVAASAHTKDLTIKYADWDGLTSADTLTAGDGTNDTLNVNATANTLTASDLTNVKGFEKIVLAADESTGAITLHNNNAAAGKSITVDGSVMATTNAVSISAVNETDGLVTLIGGAAGDTLTMSVSGAGGDTITAGGGDDNIVTTVENFTQLDTIDGGAGTADKITLSNAGTLSDASFTNVTNVEQLVSANGNTTAIMGAAAAAAGITTISLVTGSNTNSVTLGAGFTNDVTVALTDNADTVQATSYTGALTVTVAEDNIGSTDTLTGGTGSDTLTITYDTDGASSDTVTATELANVTGFETVKFASDIAVDGFTTADANIAAGKTMTIDATKLTSAAATVSAAAETNGSINYIGGAGIDTVTGGDKNDTIDGKAGADVITGGKGVDTLTGGTGADTFTYTATNQSTTSGADSITDFTSGTDKIAITLNYSTNVNALTVDATVNTAAAGQAAVASGLSGAIGQATYDTTNSQLVVNANADNLISTLDYVIGVNAAATAANTIAEGDLNFTISTGSAGDTITAGSGADTINAGAGIDTITAGAGADTINAGASDAAADQIVFTEITDGASLVTLTNIGTAADDFTATAGTTTDSITNQFVVGTDLIKIDGTLKGLLEASGATKDSANDTNLDFNAAGIWIIDDGQADLAADNFGDISDLATNFNIGVGTIANAAAGDEILFTIDANSANLTGLYYFKDVDGDGAMSAGDQVALLAIIADDTFVAGTVTVA